MRSKINMLKNQGTNALILCITAMLLFLSLTAGAQKRWGFELRPGVNFPVSSLATTDLSTGFGIEGSFSFRFMEHLAVYTGWSWNRFPSTEMHTEGKLDFEETGYTFGLQFIHPIANSRLNYLLRGGGTYNHIETENRNGRMIHDSGHGMGWQIGAGLAVPMGSRWQMLPEIRYRSLSRTINLGDGNLDADLNYISAGIGFKYSL